MSKFVGRAACFPMALFLALGASGIAEARVLKAPAAEEIGAVLRSAEPAWTHGDVTISQDQVTTRLCRAPTTHCFAVRLTDAQGDCASDRAGPWCVSWMGPAPSSEESAALVAILAKAHEDRLWTEGGTAATRPPAKDERRHPLLIGLLLLVLPVLGGWLVSRLLKLQRPERARLRALMVVALPTACVLMFPYIEVGMLDLLTIGVLASFGLITDSRPRQSLLLVLTFAGGLVVLELLLRLVMPAPPVRVFPLDFRFPHSTTSGEAPTACRALGLRNEADWQLWRRDAVPPPLPRIVHLGDSMLFGQGCGNGSTATTELERLDTGYAHINLGVPATSLDAQYALWLNLRDSLRPVGVVVHVYLGNDFREVDQPLPCCDERPVLDYANDVPQPRCSTPHWSPSVATLLGHSSAALLQRALAPISRVAACSVVPTENMMRNLGAALRQAAQPPQDVEWRHWALTLRALRNDLSARGIRLALSVIPTRRSLTGEGPDGSAADKARVLKEAAELGIPVLDPAPRLQELLAEGENRLFPRDPPGEIHFSCPGNEDYGRWLLSQLGPGMTRIPAAGATAVVDSNSP